MSLELRHILSVIASSLVVSGLIYTGFISSP